MSAPRGRFVDRVRWSDVDAAGIVCFGRYLRYFEGAEEELFRAVSLPAEAMREELGVWLVRRSVTAEFVRPVRLGDLLVTEATVARLGETSLHLDFTSRCEGEEVAAGRYVLVCVGRETLAAQPLPAILRQRFSAGEVVATDSAA